MTARKTRLVARIYSEGYCCLRGYLDLCRARKETPIGMAANIGVSEDTIWYHYRKLENTPCQGKCDCMKTLIAEVEVLVKSNSDENPHK